MIYGWDRKRYNRNVKRLLAKGSISVDKAKFMKVKKDTKDGQRRRGIPEAENTENKKYPDVKPCQTFWQQQFKEYDTETSATRNRRPHKGRRGIPEAEKDVKPCGKQQFKEYDTETSATRNRRPHKSRRDIPVCGNACLAGREATYPDVKPCETEQTFWRHNFEEHDGWPATYRMPTRKFWDGNNLEDLVKGTPVLWLGFPEGKKGEESTKREFFNGVVHGFDGDRVQIS